MVQSTQTATALTPLTVTYDDQTVDLSVPQLSPLAELIPTILRSIGRMDVYGASAGFTVSTSSGQVLDQSLCLRDQGVRAGASLTLERAGQGRDDQRFDDLVEAVGSAVENTVDPWTPLDSLQLSAYASALFVGLAGVLLLSGASQGSSLSGVVSSLNEIRTIASPIVAHPHPDSATAVGTKIALRDVGVRRGVGFVVAHHEKFAFDLYEHITRWRGLRAARGPTRQKQR